MENNGKHTSPLAQYLSTHAEAIEARFQYLEGRINDWESFIENMRAIAKLGLPAPDNTSPLS